MSSSSARIVPNSAFASQSHKSRSEFWIGDSGASCHMTNDASKMYYMRPPHYLTLTKKKYVKKGKRGACQQKAATVLPNRTAAN